MVERHRPMSGLTIMKAKHRLREMNGRYLPDAIDTTDQTLAMRLPFEGRMCLAVNDTYVSYRHGEVAAPIRPAGLRYPSADLQRIDPRNEPGLDGHGLTQLGSGTLVTGGTSLCSKRSGAQPPRICNTRSH